MKKARILKKVIMLSAALVMITPVASTEISQSVLADESTNAAPTTTPNTSAENTTSNTNSEATDVTLTTPSKHKVTQTHVKTFKVGIIKKNYKIFTGIFKKKTTSNHYFHKIFTVKKTSTFHGKKYYWLIGKSGKTVGYINPNAVAKTNKSRTLKVPYVSQYTPVKTPWGCAGASMTMLLRSQGKKVNLTYVQNHLPMYPTKGGQKGNVYTGYGFGYVIQPGALAKYARRWDKKVINVSSKKLSLNDIKMYVQAGKPVLYYGYSSYQKPGNYYRNHCKVIAGYKNGKFLVKDPLYYSKNAKAGDGGKNMSWDRGAVSWVSKADIQSEFNHQAITVK